MAFTMSYGAEPKPTPAETTAKITAKKAPARRSRKGESLQTKAQALFGPAPVSPEGEKQGLLPHPAAGADEPLGEHGGDDDRADRRALPVG